MSGETALDRALPFINFDLFWAKIQKGTPDVCWPWVGAKFPKGHGAFCAWDSEGERRLMVRAHRVVHYLETGEQPEAVMHTCDNPPCCNPAHLQSGTVLANNVDRDKKDRVRHGERHADAKLTAAQVELVKAMAGPGVTQADIAYCFGVSPSLVSMILSGKRRKRG